MPDRDTRVPDRAAFRTRMMSRYLLPLLFAFGGTLGSSACRDGSRALVEVERDTLVLYGPTRTPLPIRITDRTGAGVGLHRATVLVERDDFVSERYGGLVCRRAGVTRVSVTFEDATVTFVAACRPARAFYGPRLLELEVGDPPRALGFTAVLASGAIDSIRPAEISVGDTQVVRVRNDRLVPVAAGRTNIYLNLGGAGTSLYAVVTETMASDTIALTPGESRTWRLPPGRYTLHVTGVPHAANFTGLEMVTEGARCVPGGMDEDTIHCMVYERGAVVMRNNSRRSDDRPTRAMVSIVRTP